MEIISIWKSSVSKKETFHPSIFIFNFYFFFNKEKKNSPKPKCVGKKVKSMAAKGGETLRVLWGIFVTSLYFSLYFKVAFKSRKLAYFDIIISDVARVDDPPWFNDRLWNWFHWQ